MHGVARHWRMPACPSKYHKVLLQGELNTGNSDSSAAGTMTYCCPQELLSIPHNRNTTRAQGLHCICAGYSSEDGWKCSMLTENARSMDETNRLSKNSLAKARCNLKPQQNQLSYLGMICYIQALHCLCVPKRG
jgi:hypothetical protein